MLCVYTQYINLLYRYSDKMLAKNYFSLFRKLLPNVAFCIQRKVGNL